MGNLLISGARSEPDGIYPLPPRDVRNRIPTWRLLGGFGRPPSYFPTPYFGNRPAGAMACVHILIFRCGRCAAYFQVDIGVVLSTDTRDVRRGFLYAEQTCRQLVAFIDVAR